MAHKAFQPFKGAVARVRGWRASRRAKYVERKQSATNAGSGDPWNHMYRGG